VVAGVKRGPHPGAVDVLLAAALVGLSAVTLYPLVYVISMSVSGADAVVRQQVFLYPIGFSVGSYRLILANRQIWLSYYNTLWYTAVGTTINVVVTLMAAYALSRREFFARKPIMILVTVTMFFSGGLVPLFVLINGLGLYNTRWSIVLPVAVNTYNLIIARTYLHISIHDSIPESAKMDGCSDVTILWRIVLPVAQPIIAVLTIFYAVSHWNAWFGASLFLNDVGLHPLQLYLRKLLLQSELDSAVMMEMTTELTAYMQQLKYACIVVATLPILCVYPFLQRYFVQGVMLGAIKE
jgi:putative aldouronate transport system permease protein